MIHQFANQLTKILQSLNSMKIDETVTKQSNIKKTMKSIEKSAKRIRFCYMSRKENIDLLFARSSFEKMIQNVIVFRHRFSRIWKSIQTKNRITTYTHYLKRMKFSNLNSFIFIWSILTKTQTKIIKWRLRTNDLKWLSFTNSKIEKEKSLMNEIQSKNVKDFANNISYDENHHKWMTIDSLLRTWCRIEKRKERLKLSIELITFFVLYKVSRKMLHEQAFAFNWLD